MTLGLFFEGTEQGGAGESAAVCAAVSEAVERMSERADTAYSPRFREEEHSATASLPTATRRNPAFRRKIAKHPCSFSLIMRQCLCTPELNSVATGV